MGFTTMGRIRGTAWAASAWNDMRKDLVSVFRECCFLISFLYWIWLTGKNELAWAQRSIFTRLTQQHIYRWMASTDDGMRWNKGRMT